MKEPITSFGSGELAYVEAAMPEVVILADAQRIASAIFSAPGVDAQVIEFATRRAAEFRGVPVPIAEAQVFDCLQAIATRVGTDLRRYEVA